MRSLDLVRRHYYRIDGEGRKRAGGIYSWCNSVDGCCERGVSLPQCVQYWFPAFDMGIETILMFESEVSVITTLFKAKTEQHSFLAA